MEITREHLKSIENLHTGYASAMSTHYGEIVGRVVDVDIAFIDHTTYGELIDSLSNPGCAYTLVVQPTGDQFLCEYSMPVAAGLIKHGAGEKADGPLTPEEYPVMGKVLTRDMENLEAAWKPIADVQITDAQLETNPNLMQIAERNEWVVLVAFEINGPDFSGLKTLCYPDSTLQPALPQLG